MIEGNSGAISQRSRPTSPKPSASSVTAFHSHGIPLVCFHVRLRGQVRLPQRLRMVSGPMSFVCDANREEVPAGVRVRRVGFNQPTSPR